MFPPVDVGADLIIDSGLRLQVKTAKLTYPVAGRPPYNNYLGGAYGFCVRRGAYENKHWNGKAKIGYADVADFFVLWGIDENRFWIVPTSIKNRVIWFGRLEHPNNSNNASYSNKRKLDRIAAYENRWDLLDVNQTVETLIESEPAQVPKEI